MFISQLSAETESRLVAQPDRAWTDVRRAVLARFGSDGKAMNASRVYLHYPVLADNILPFEQYIYVQSLQCGRHSETEHRVRFALRDLAAGDMVVAELPATTSRLERASFVAVLCWITPQAHRGCHP